MDKTTYPHFGTGAALLVYDNINKKLVVPPAMGTPRDKHLRSTPDDNLIELAGRCCYDSINAETSRDTVGYHAHIHEVKHGSVWEHPGFVVAVGGRNDIDAVDILRACLNRPGIGLLPDARMGYWRISCNPRHLNEWDRYSRPCHGVFANRLGAALRTAVHPLCPLAVPVALEKPEPWAAVTEPMHPDEIWVSFWLCGSRGFSHEQVRHRLKMSQRCLSGDSVVTFVAPNGHAYSGHIGKKSRTMKWLFDRKHKLYVRDKLRPRVLDETTGAFTSGRILDVIHSGKKPCFIVKLENGKAVTCTADHKIYTNDGWRTLTEIVNPVLSTGHVVQWNRDSRMRIATNGIVATGSALYRDREWMHEQYIVLDASLQEVADRASCSVAVVRKYLCLYGIRKRPRTDCAATPVADQAWLFEKIHVLGWSHAKIAQVAGCTKASVHNYARKFGIQKGLREINLGRAPWNKGKEYSRNGTYSPETIERYRKSKLGERNPQWRGGVHPEARRSFQSWKRAHRFEVFQRDGWACRVCNRSASEVPVNNKHLRKRRIEIHHIMPLWNRPDLACDINNMATVCWQCQCRLNHHELDFAAQLLEAIKSPIAYEPSGRKRGTGRRCLRVSFSKVESVHYAGEIDTYDLVLEGPNHGFVADGVVVHNSTRFVDESEADWHPHPILLADEESLKQLESVREAAALAYDDIVRRTQERLTAAGLDKLSARKQARGAARGILGNALETQMIFTASLGESGWPNILRQRVSNFADAEIRVIASQVYEQLRQAYPARFASLEAEPARDGFGLHLTSS